jgi:acyl-CoA reductase-like NAD-dependent aldehyde dehydrogenase
MIEPIRRDLAGLTGLIRKVSAVPASTDVNPYLQGNFRVQMASFTGSTRAGRRGAALAGQGLKRVTLELGANYSGDAERSLLISVRSREV